MSWTGVVPALTDFTEWLELSTLTSLAWETLISFSSPDTSLLVLLLPCHLHPGYAWPPATLLSISSPHFLKDALKLWPSPLSKWLSDLPLLLPLTFTFPLHYFNSFSFSTYHLKLLICLKLSSLIFIETTKVRKLKAVNKIKKSNFKWKQAHN